MRACAKWQPRRWALPEALASRGGISGLTVVMSLLVPGILECLCRAGSPHWGPLLEALERPTEDRKKVGLLSAWLFTKHGLLAWDGPLS